MDYFTRIIDVINHTLRPLSADMSGIDLALFLYLLLNILNELLSYKKNSNMFLV